MEKQDLIIKIINNVSELYGDDKYKQRKLENSLSILLKNCTIIETGTQIVPSTQDNYYIIAKFLACKKVQGLTKATLSNYKGTAIAFFNLIGNKELKDITTDDVRYFLATGMEQHKWSNAHADNLRRYLSTFFSWCIDEDLMIKNPVKRMKPIAKRQRVRKPFTEVEVEKMREYLSEHEKCLRDRAILEVLLSTGCRASEVQNIKLQDVDFINKEIFVVGKGDKERKVFLNEKAIYYLKKYITEGNRDESCEYLFQSLIKSENRGLKISGMEIRLRKMGEELGFKVYPHKFRHTAATWAIQRGMPIEQVKQMLGHEQMDTTLIYAQMNTEDLKSNHRRYMQ